MSKWWTNDVTFSTLHFSSSPIDSSCIQWGWSTLVGSNFDAALQYDPEPGLRVRGWTYRMLFGRGDLLTLCQVRLFKARSCHRSSYVNLRTKSVWVWNSGVATRTIRWRFLKIGVPQIYPNHLFCTDSIRNHSFCGTPFLGNHQKGQWPSISLKLRKSQPWISWKNFSPAEARPPGIGGFNDLDTSEMTIISYICH